MPIPTPVCHSLASRSLASRSCRAFAALALAGVLASSLSAQTRPAGDEANRRRGDQGADAGGRRGGGSPEEMQARMLASLRERFEVTDDEEWKLIAERLGKVTELRRNAAGAGGFGGFAGRGPGGPGGAPGGDRGGPAAGRGGRGPGGGSTEMAALSGAVRDKLPDAEIKSRLDRVREIRKDNEAKLAKAQEELRAVLSVRQEAIAVVFGLLP